LTARLSVTYPIYLRENYRSDRVPLREVMRFVSNVIL